MRVEKFGEVVLYHARCEDVLQDIAADVVLSDPPYGMKYKSGHNKGRKADDKMVRKDGNFAPILGDQRNFDPSPILSLGLPTILWGGNHFNDKLPPHTRWLVWNKLCGKTPVPSASDIEIAWCSLPGPDRIFDHLWRGIMRAGEENVVNGPKLHPHQKPVNLMAWCLGFLPEGIVLDPYMGSGSAGVAAVRAGRGFCGIEFEEAYFETACTRLRAEVASRQGNLL